jgi:NAD(P)-dependent dehydrogenase (short-subunit alcohol dehydrogenase family)
MGPRDLGEAGDEGLEAFDALPIRLPVPPLSRLVRELLASPARVTASIGSYATAIELEGAADRTIEEPAFVGDEEDGATLADDELLEPCESAEIEVVAWLVQENQLWLAGEGRSEGQDIFFASRKKSGLAPRDIGQAQAIEEARGAFRGSLGAKQLVGRAQLAVLDEGPIEGAAGEEAEFLALSFQSSFEGPSRREEDFEAAEALLRLEALGHEGDPETRFLYNAALVVLIEAREDAQEAGLSRTVQAYETDLLARVDREGCLCDDPGAGPVLRDRSAFDESYGRILAMGPESGKRAGNARYSFIDTIAEELAPVGTVLALHVALDKPRSGAILSFDIFDISGGKKAGRKPMDISELFRLEGRVALVTGSGRGIGKALAEGFAAAGARVWVNARDPDKGQRVAEAIGGRFIRADISSSADIAEMAKAIGDEEGRLDVLVNNAAIEFIMPFEKTDLKLSEQTWRVNVRAAEELTLALLPLMKRSSGASIINITSIHDSMPYPHNLDYNMSKAALHMFTSTLALELGPMGIRINNLAPGAVETDLNREVIDEIGRDKFGEWIPLGRVARVEEMIGPAIFLASSASSYVNGATLYADGGYKLNLVRYRP